MIRLILVIVLAWVILSYFHIDVRALVSDYLPWIEKAWSGLWYLIQNTIAVIKS
jgi:hypothetical protein